MNCGLSFEKKSKKIKKKFASSEKSLTFATPIQKGCLKPENDPRLDPRTQAADKSFLNYFEMDARRTK